MPTKILPITDLRRDTSRIVQGVQEEGDVVYVTQHGRAAVVIVDYEQYQALLAQLEDLTDLAAMEKALQEPRRSYGAFADEMELEEKPGK